MVVCAAAVIVGGGSLRQIVLGWWFVVGIVWTVCCCCFGRAWVCLVRRRWQLRWLVGMRGPGLSWILHFGLVDDGVLVGDRKGMEGFVGCSVSARRVDSMLGLMHRLFLGLGLVW